MLTLQSHQLNALEQAGSPSFVALMRAHVRESFPKHSSYLGGEGVGEIVRYGLEQGHASGFRTRSPVRLFIDLTVLLGRDFHSDPQLPWARTIIEDHAGFPDELERATRLHGAATEYLDSVSGPDNEFIDNAQQRILLESLAISGGSKQAFIDAVCFRLERIWPEKLSQLDNGLRNELIDLGVRKALAHGIGTEEGAFLCIAIMLMLGSGFDHDPLCGWSHPVLTSTDSAAVKIALLHAAAIGHLTKWCAGESECHV